MEKEVNSIEDLAAVVEEHTGDITVLFMDVSSTCIGYSIGKIDFLTKKATIIKAGALWLDQNWSHADKYSFIFHAILDYFWIIQKIDYIVVESYSINPNRMMGSLVVPEMMGAIKVAANEHGIKVDSITPQTWRKQLGIKRVKDVKDWKEPTKQKILELVNVPEEVISNITDNTRKTPSDLYDAIAVSLGWLKRLGLTNIDTKNVEINPHIGYDFILRS